MSTGHRSSRGKDGQHSDSEERDANNEQERQAVKDVILRQKNHFTHEKRMRNSARNSRICEQAQTEASSSLDLLSQGRSPQLKPVLQ